MDYQSTGVGDGWEEVVSFEGKFKITFAGAVMHKSDTVLTDIGKLNYNVFYNQLNQKAKSDQEAEAAAADNLLFMLSIYDYPTYSIHSDSIEVLKEFFDATIEGAAQGVNGELIYANDIKMDQYPGKLWRINYNNGEGVIRTKAYLIQKRLYLLSVVAEKTYGMNNVSDRFFDSFEILE
jgi:hypothetical protein